MGTFAAQGVHSTSLHSYAVCPAYGVKPLFLQNEEPDVRFDAVAAAGLGTGGQEKK